MYLNKKLNFKPLRDNEKAFIYLESFDSDGGCSNCTSAEACKACYSEVIKGKQTALDNANSNLKKVSDENTSNINKLNNTIKQIQDQIDKINSDVSTSTQDLTKTQNDLLTKLTKANSALKKGQDAANKYKK
jgi:uncharacterized phage infection (PIP) family protein YhgE